MAQLVGEVAILTNAGMAIVVNDRSPQALNTVTAEKASGSPVIKCSIDAPSLVISVSAQMGTPR
jgi:hypothetical protein